MPKARPEEPRPGPAWPQRSRDCSPSRARPAMAGALSEARPRRCLGRSPKHGRGGAGHLSMPEIVRRGEGSTGPPRQTRPAAQSSRAQAPLGRSADLDRADLEPIDSRSARPARRNPRRTPRPRGEPGRCGRYRGRMEARARLWCQDPGALRCPHRGPRTCSLVRARPVPPLSRRSGVASHLRRRRVSVRPVRPPPAAPARVDVRPPTEVERPPRIRALSRLPADFRPFSAPKQALHVAYRRVPGSDRPLEYTSSTRPWCSSMARVCVSRPSACPAVRPRAERSPTNAGHPR